MSKLFRDSTKVIPFPDIENAYLIISCVDDEKIDFDILLRPTMSFFYDGGNCGTEWEPQYGPIQLWYPTKDTDEEKTREHYFYDRVVKGFGDWSQLAVEREELKPAFLRGDYRWVFSVLKRWSER